MPLNRSKAILSKRSAVLKRTIAKAIGDMVMIRKNWLIDLAVELETYEDIYDNVKRLHKPLTMNDSLNKYCWECSQNYPCNTLRRIEEIENDL